MSGPGASRAGTSNAQTPSGANRDAADPKPAPAIITARSTRLASGLVLGVFFVMHFVNLALGLVSTAAMEAGRPFLTGLWSGVPGMLLLYGAAAVHFGLSLRAVSARRILRFTGREAAQVSLGVLLPFLLVPHVVVTEIAPRLAGHPVTFAFVVNALWVTSPWVGARQVLALAVGWAHLCLGVWFWLRSKPVFPRLAPFLLAGALLVPLAATLGFAEAGKEVARLPPPVVPGPAGLETTLDAIRLSLEFALLGSVGAILLAHGMRSWRGRHHRVRVGYANGRSINVPKGFTLLEASRAAHIPHVSVCGGRGRCSTCRVRILVGLDGQPAAEPIERQALTRVRAAPNVRLACQLRPTQDLTVDLVFSRAPDNPAAAAHAAGRERELAVLFCDLRGFTRRAEQWLPYDTVFILNRYFEIVGQAIEGAGGYLDKFVGDGALALFGLDVPLDAACRQALRAAGDIARRLEALNGELRAELSDPLRIAMGLHAGPAVVGEMGFGRARSITAVGDGINVASRLEGAAKELDMEAVISTALVARAGVTLDHPRRTVAVRGRQASVEAVLVPVATSLNDHAGFAAPSVGKAESSPSLA